MKRSMFYTMLISASCIAGEMTEDFNLLVESYGKEYVILRERMLEKNEAKDYLDSIINDKELPQVKKAQALILQEWMNNKTAIRENLAIQVIDHTPKRRDVADTPLSDGFLPPPKWNTPRGGFHYPFWHSLPADKLETLMKAYNANPCPWFILECLWKFNLDDRRDYGEAELVVKPFSDMPKYTHHNPQYVFFGMVREMPEDQKVVFAAVLEEINKKMLQQSVETQISLIEKLAYLGLPRSLDVTIEAIQRLEDTQSVSVMMLKYLPLFKINIGDKEELSKLKLVAGMIGNMAGYEGRRDFLNSFIDAIESNKAINDEWVIMYANLLWPLGPFSFYEHAIYRLRPDLRGRLIEEREGSSRRVIITDENKQQK